MIAKTVESILENKTEKKKQRGEKREVGV